MAGTVDLGNSSTAATLNNLVVASGNMSSTSYVKALAGTLGNVSVSGSISASQITANSGITAIDAGGAINSAITANANGGTGAITRLTSTSGGFAGSLQAAAISGGVDTDGIKLSGANAHLSANITISGNAARQIDIAGNSTGTVSIGGNLNTGNASRLLRVGGSASGAINITGSVSTPVQINTLSSNLTVGGSVASGGSITVTNGLASARTIKIGGSLAGDIVLSPLANALAGQIIINAANTGGTWSGDVVVGSATLDSATYDESASSLGGGSVGVVGYNIHLESCDPAYSRSLNDYPQLEECPTISLRWYGPLESAYGLSVWFTDGSSYDDVPSSFTFGLDPADSRQVIVTPSTPNMPVGMYWIYPSAISLVHEGYDYVLCRNADLVGATDVPVAQDTYIFEIIAGLPRSGGDSMSELSSPPTPCIADADCDTSITALDIATFLNLYLTSDTTSATPECPGHTADINGDTIIDASDIATFLAAWYARCE